MAEENLFWRRVFILALDAVVGGFALSYVAAAFGETRLTWNVGVAVVVAVAVCSGYLRRDVTKKEAE